MIRAYNECYLSDAKRHLASFFDYGVNDCKVEVNWLSFLFVQSGDAERFQRGNPSYVAGMSGYELAYDVLRNTRTLEEFPVVSHGLARTAEYWAGWALAEYQWSVNRRFNDIFNRIPMREVVEMYPTFHEMDISQFIDEMDGRYVERTSVSNLQRIRRNRGISQSELSRLSQVNLRSIQLYEQKVNDIDKAQGQTLFKLAWVLGCDIADILEHPSS